MPGIRCAVAVCNWSFANRHLADELITFHCLPKVPKLRKIWIQRCHRHNNWNPRHARVCSEHFLPEDYERDLRSELMNLPPKRLLKSGAVPKQFLKFMPVRNVFDIQRRISRSDWQQRRSPRQCARELIKEASNKCKETEISETTKCRNSDTTISKHSDFVESINFDTTEKEIIGSLEMEITYTPSVNSCDRCVALEGMRTKYEALQKELNALKENMERMQHAVADCQHKLRCNHTYEVIVIDQQMVPHVIP